MKIDSLKFALPNLKRVVGQGLEEVEKQLLKQVSGHDDLIDPVIGHLAKAGGKRLRPMLTLVCSKLGDEKTPVSEQAIRCALAVELIHIATLYHDDVMDSAPVRRGAVAVQEQWSNTLAILGGDLLFARASQIVATLPPSMILRHAVTFERLCAGQMHETFGPEPDEDPVEHYLSVLSDKTASLLATSVRFGGECANASEEVLQALEIYGEQIGVAYQLVDDIIDLRADTATSGKTPGTDLLEGVDTMPVLLLRQRLMRGELDSEGQKLLADIDSDLRSNGKLESVLSRLSASSVVKETMQIALAKKDEALRAIEVLPKGEVKKALVVFADMVVNRDK